MEKRKNKDIIQSYVLTVARYDANVYAKRILTHIVNANQDYIQGERLGGAVINIDEDLFRERNYTFDVKNILQGEEDKNYKRIIDAFHSLQNKFLRFDDEDNNHISVPFIMGLKLERGSGCVKFRMSELVYKAFSDFSRGFRKVEFELTLSFASVYSIRIYELLSGQKQPLTRTIDELKMMFGIEDKYVNKPTNFIKRVIEPAKKELDEKSPYTFTYKVNKKGRAFHSITFFPVYQAHLRNEDLEVKDLQKKVSLSWYMDKNIKEYLIHNFDFTTTEIKQNTALFEVACNELDLINFMSKIKTRLRTSDVKNPQGYLINAIRKELNRLEIEY